MFPVFEFLVFGSPLYSVLGSFQCSYCDVSFFGQKSFHVHANKMHAKAISKVWQPCPFKKCKQYFPSFKSLRIHTKECPKRKSSSATQSSAARIQTQNSGNFGSLWLTPWGPFLKTCTPFLAF